MPRDAAVVDRRRSEIRDQDEIKALIAAHVKARQAPMDPYSALVLLDDPVDAFSDVERAFRVHYDGRSRQVSEFDSQRLMGLREEIWSGKLRLPEGIDPATWWAQELAGMPFAPFRGPGLDNGPFAWDVVGAPVSNYGLPSPKNEFEFTLDRHPASGPEGTVLLRMRLDSGDRFNEAPTGSIPNAVT